MDRFDGQVGAFVNVNRQAFDANAGPDCAPQPLAGLPVGVKDVIDVAGFSTGCGNRTREQSAPVTIDADLVRLLRDAGAVPVGKTVTTEYAFLDPTRTRNPYRLTHTPGGSSSGSAAAVVAGFIPVALGTQTAGSLCRPAAYCGVAAIKPSFGFLSTRGVVPLAPSFDTVGLIARTVDDASTVLRAISDLPAATSRSWKMGVLTTRFHASSSLEICDFHEEAIGALEASGFHIEVVDPNFDPQDVIADHRHVMLFEAAQEHGALLRAPESLGPMFRAALEEGISISAALADAARFRIEQTRKRAWESIRDLDGLLLQPVPDTAPRGFATTGDQSYQTPWTALHGPLVVAPGRMSRDGLPMAAMIAGPPGSDAKTVAIASELERRLDVLPDYVAAPGAGSSAK
jgi:Asp-tRNA(Asn)/Glu-tRNA(Gln) amidotransferase A subunit family amidase